MLIKRRKKESMVKSTMSWERFENLLRESGNLKPNEVCTDMRVDEHGIQYGISKFYEAGEKV